LPVFLAVGQAGLNQATFRQAAPPKEDKKQIENKQLHGFLLSALMAKTSTIQEYREHSTVILAGSA